MNGPAPTLVNDWITAPFMWAVVGAFVLAWLGIWVGHEWHKIGQELDQINHTFDTQAPHVERQLVAYHCAAHGHAFRHPELHNGRRVLRCEACGVAVVSDPGWIDGGAA